MVVQTVWCVWLARLFSTWSAIDFHLSFIELPFPKWNTTRAGLQRFSFSYDSQIQWNGLNANRAQCLKQVNPFEAITRFICNAKVEYQPKRIAEHNSKKDNIFVLTPSRTRRFSSAGSTWGNPGKRNIVLKSQQRIQLERAYLWSRRRHCPNRPGQTYVNFQQNLCESINNERNQSSDEITFIRE